MANEIARIYRVGPTIETMVPVEQFKWRDSKGQFHAAGDMETRHLFYTFRMIWNHTMPAEARSPEYKHYRFGPFYTQDYMRDAVMAIGQVLFDRKDLSTEWRRELERMRRWFDAHLDELAEQKYLAQVAE